MEKFQIELRDSFFSIQNQWNGDERKHLSLGYQVIRGMNSFGRILLLQILFWRFWPRKRTPSLMNWKASSGRIDSHFDEAYVVLPFIGSQDQRFHKCYFIWMIYGINFVEVIEGFWERENCSGLFNTLLWLFIFVFSSSGLHLKEVCRLWNNSHCRLNIGFILLKFEQPVPLNDFELLIISQVIIDISLIKYRILHEIVLWNYHVRVFFFFSEAEVEQDN